MSNYIFKPYSFVSTKNVNGYFSGNPSFAYGTNVLVWMGARRCGKTFSALKYCIKNFIRKGYQFVWLRDNDNARLALSSNHGAKFFSDVKLMPNYKDKVKGTIEGNTIYINGKTAGYLMPSSTFQNFKGNAFNEVKIIVYDEFIPEISTRKMEGRDWQIVNMIYTIASTRNDIRLLMLSNSLDKSDSLLQFLQVNIKDYGIYVNREKSVTLHYCDNSKEFIQRRENSVMGKLIKGSYMEDNLFNNKFIGNDESLFYIKRPTRCKIVAILDNGVKAVRIYVSKEDQKFYVSADFNEDSYPDIRYVNNIALVNSKKMLLPKYKKEAFINALNEKRMLFANAFVKETFLEVIGGLK